MIIILKLDYDDLRLSKAVKKNKTAGRGSQYDKKTRSLFLNLTLKDILVYSSNNPIHLLLVALDGIYRSIR